MYLHKYFPELRDELTPMQQAVFDRGHEVGALARRLFPGGINASPDLPKDWERAIQYTSELLAADTGVIYEAGFSAEGVHCFMDILVREKEGWHAYEVKSSTNLSNINQIDAAFQYYVMKSCGLKLTGIDIVVLNNSYTRSGEIDIRQLFTRHSVTNQALRLQPLIGKKIRELWKILEESEVPDIDIGPHCTDPYACDFMGHCWQHVPPHSVFDVNGLTGQKKWELYGRGILKMVDIPSSYPLNPSQKIQVLGTEKRYEKWNRTELKKFVDSLTFPLYFLDFESFQPAVPLFDQSRPYQQIPFQYSLHRLDGWNSEPLHMEHLAQAGTDPRPKLAEQLIQHAGNEGDILVYSQAFEKRIINDLIRDFPVFKTALTAFSPRIRDLMDPFRKKHIYLSEMKGSYSIKQVLPALVPGYGYDNLSIADGGMASISFQKLFNLDDNEQARKLRQNLLEYCGMDTMGMVKILKVMKLSI